MISKIKNIIIKIFNNPFGRYYLGVPQGKQIYKITKNSVHYYTGEIAKNGLPIICTGGCNAGGKTIFNKTLRLSKIVTCFALLPFLPKTLPLFALTDTGLKSPTETGVTYNNWTNPTYAYADDSNYATVTGYGKLQSYSSFGFSIPSGATIVGIEMSCKAKASADTSNVGYYVGTISGKFNGGTGQYWNTTESTVSRGGASDLWSDTWAVSNFDDSDFWATVQSRNEPSDTILSLNHIQVKVYYTVVSGPANVKTYKGLASASVKTCKGLAIASIKTKKGLN